jgi:hypothetical protein
MTGLRLYATLLLLVAWPASATTWVPADIDDPFVPGAKCDGMQPASSGSYIYHWPSKYDQVFWPYTDASGIWYCPASGFVSFVGDNKLEAAEATRVRAWLATQPTGAPPEGAAMLERIEGVYAVREADEAQRIHLLRVLAYRYDELRDAAAAARHRGQALERIRVALAGELAAQTRAEYLFVAAAYSREAGDAAQSGRDLAALDLALTHLGGEDADYAGYLRDLASVVPLITPGGVLAPGKEAEERLQRARRAREEAQERAHAASAATRDAPGSAAEAADAEAVDPGE